MSRTCGDCGSTWDGRATFCGRCGGLLDEGLAAHRGRGDAVPWWRGAGAGALAVAVVVAGAVATVPRLSIERVPPVDGEIGVPEPGDLNAAPASARTRDRVPDPPEISCTVDDEPVACITWARKVLLPESAERGGGWFMGVGGDHLLAAGNDGLTVFDADTGTRLWRIEEMAAFPLGASDGRVLVEVQGRTSMRDLDDGTVVWSAPKGTGFLGSALVGDVVVVSDHGAMGNTRVVGLDVDDGAVRWEHGLPGGDHHVAGAVADGWVLVEATDGKLTHIVIDAASGEVVSQLDASPGWLVGVVDGFALHVVERRNAPSDPNLAGDGGATLTATRLEDETVAWSQVLPSAQEPVHIADGTVLASITDHLRAIDIASGATRWDLELAGSLAAADHGSRSWWGPWSTADDWSTVAVVHDQVDDLLRAHDLASGEVLWERTLDVELQHVFVAEDVLMVFGGDEVVLLDPTTGAERLSVVLDGSHLSGWDPLTVVHPPSGHAALLDLPGADVP